MPLNRSRVSTLQLCFQGKLADALCRVIESVGQDVPSELCDIAKTNRGSKNPSRGLRRGRTSSSDFW